MKKSIIAAILILTGIMTGCSRNEPTETENKPPDSGLKADMKLAVDGFTGRAAVNAGNKARDTIEKVSEERDKELKEIMP